MAWMVSVPVVVSMISGGCGVGGGHVVEIRKIEGHFEKQMETKERKKIFIGKKFGGLVL